MKLKSPNGKLEIDQKGMFLGREIILNLLFRKKLL